MAQMPGRNATAKTITAASAHRVSVVPASSWVGDGTSTSLPCGSCSNAISPASRPPFTAMTESLDSAIVPTNPADAALSHQMPGGDVERHEATVAEPE